jgi:transketolase
MSEKMRYGCSLKGMRQTLEDTLLELGSENEKIIVVDCETGTATNILAFRDTYPDRYVTTGVAEQSGISFAFGVARTGYIPIVPLFGAFVSRRALDQVFIQIGYGNVNVKLLGCYSGLTTPNTGATHQTVNDVSIMRSIPNLKVVETADPTELHQAIIEAVKYTGPVYLRMIRGDIAPYDGDVVPEGHRFVLDKASVLRPGKDISLIGSGMMVSRCMEAAEILAKRGVQAEVVNCSSIKPIDAETIIGSVRKTGKAVTAENHSILGGMGSAVAEVVVRDCPVPMRMVGINDCYGESGPLEDLFEAYGLTTNEILKAAEELLKH